MLRTFTPNKTAAWFLSTNRNVTIFSWWKDFFWITQRFYLLVLLISLKTYMGKPQQIKEESNIVVPLSYVSLSTVFILLPDTYSWLSGRADMVSFDLNFMSEPVFLCTYFLFDITGNQKQINNLQGIKNICTVVQNVMMFDW